MSDVLMNKEKHNQAEEFKVTEYSLEEFLEDDYQQLNVPAEPINQEPLQQEKEKDKQSYITRAELSVEFKFAQMKVHEYKDDLPIYGMKNSTLAKRHKEYLPKYNEKKAMLEAKNQLEEFKHGELNSLKFNELKRNAMKNSNLNFCDSDNMTAVLPLAYFAEKENMTMDEMTVAYQDMNYDLGDVPAEGLEGLNKKAAEKVKDHFKGKMIQYEKLFSEVMSWNINDFELKNNHEMAKGDDFVEKMKRLSLIPSVKNAVTEYRTVLEDGRMEKIRGKEAKGVMSPELLKELEARLDYYENVGNEYQCRMDMMSNKYYTLLGQSDTANLSIADLKELAGRKKSNDKDAELCDYYDALARMKEIKRDKKSVKGKSPKDLLNAARKKRGIKTGSSYENHISDSLTTWTGKSKMECSNMFKRRQETAEKEFITDSLSYSFDDPKLVESEIDTIYKSLGITLEESKKQKILADFEKRFSDSQRAEEFLYDADKNLSNMMNKMEARLLKDYPDGFAVDLREEVYGMAEYLMDPKFIEAGEEEQYKIYRTVMLPYTKAFTKMTEEEKKRVSDAADDAVIGVFRDTLENDHQLDILTKYGSPEEFMDKCTSEEFSYLMRLRHIGGWINNAMFEKKLPGLLKRISEDEFKKFYVQMSKSAYGFSSGLVHYVRLVANKNYAFMDKDTIQKLNVRKRWLSLSKEQQEKAPADQKAIAAAKIKSRTLQSLQLSQNAVDTAWSGIRVGKAAKNLMEEDAYKFDNNKALMDSFKAIKG